MAEDVEGRGLAKGKRGEQTRVWTQCRGALQHALDRLRQAARRDHAKPLTALWHHVYDINRLREAYHGLNREAAPGVDGQTWAAYGENLEVNLRDLSDRLKRGGYFDAIDHAWLLKFIEHRIGDQRVVHHMQKWLQAGVLEKGQWQFPTADHRASWAGMCPGHHESAGKRKSGRTTKGSPYLRAALVQAAWAAQSRRLVKRRWPRRSGAGLPNPGLQPTAYSLR